MADQLPIPPAENAPQVPVENPVVTGGAQAAPSPAQPAVPPTTPPAEEAPTPILGGFGVNFYREQLKRLEEHLDTDKKIARYTMSGLALFIVVLIGVMAIYYLLALEQRKLADETDRTAEQLTMLSTLEKEYIVYASKIKLLAALDSERTIKRNATSYFYALVPSVNVMREVRTDDEKEESTISFSIESPDVFALLDLLKAFGTKEVYDKGYLLTVSDLSRVADGTYVISGSMNYARANDLALLGAK